MPAHGAFSASPRCRAPLPAELIDRAATPRPAVDHASIRLELLQTLGQHYRRSERHDALKVREAPLAARQIAYDQRAAVSIWDAGGMGYGTGLERPQRSPRRGRMLGSRYSAW